MFNTFPVIVTALPCVLYGFVLGLILLKTGLEHSFFSNAVIAEATSHPLSSLISNTFLPINKFGLAEKVCVAKSNMKSLLD